MSNTRAIKMVGFFLIKRRVEETSKKKQMDQDNL